MFAFIDDVKTLLKNMVTNKISVLNKKYVLVNQSENDLWDV